MKLFQTCLILLALAFQGAVSGADLATLTKGCDGCHGPEGVSTDSDIPSIAGQSPEYLTAALRSFQEWGRPCKTSAYRHGDTSRAATKMCKLAASLSEDEVQALGEHYGAMKFTAAKQDFDAAKAAAGRQLHQNHCESCHIEGGSASGRGPILAGQWVPYLKVAAAQALTGEHLVPPLMEKQLTDFTEEEMNALMNFYASQQD